MLGGCGGVTEAEHGEDFIGSCVDFQCDTESRIAPGSARVPPDFCFSYRHDLANFDADVEREGKWLVLFRSLYLGNMLRRRYNLVELE